MPGRRDSFHRTIGPRRGGIGDLRRGGDRGGGRRRGRRNAVRSARAEGGGGGACSGWGALQLLGLPSLEDPPRRGGQTGRGGGVPVDAGVGTAGLGDQPRRQHSPRPLPARSGAGGGGGRGGS